MDVLIQDERIAYFVIQNGMISDSNEQALLMFHFQNQSEIYGLPFTVLFKEQKEPILDYFDEAKDKGHFQWYCAELNHYIVLFYINHQHVAYFMTNPLYLFTLKNQSHMLMLIEPESLKIIDVNQMTIDFYGYSKEELLSMSLSDIHALDKAQWNGSLDQLTSIMKHQLKNKNLVDIEFISFPVELNSQSVLLCVLTDVSDRIQQTLMSDELFLNSPFAIAIIDNYQHVININNRFTQLFQYDFTDIYFKNINDFITTDEYRNEASLNLDLLFKNSILKLSTLRKKKDNSLVNVEIVAFPIVYNNAIIGAYIHYMDITQSVEAQQELEVFKSILENSNEGIMITDALGSIEWINHTFTKITGYLLPEIKGKNPRILKSNLYQPEFYKEMWKQLTESGIWSGEIWNKNKQGVLYPEWLTIHAIQANQKTKHYVGMFKDLSESKIIDQRMHVLAQKDALTGLYNRIYFTEQCQNLFTQKKIAPNNAIFFLDLDRFKEINDSLGHLVGDQFLIELAKRMNKYFNQNSLIARYGGDEFVILIQNVTFKQQIYKIARDLSKLISEPFFYLNNYLQTSASIGISIYPKDGLTTDELIQNADIAMYVAKNHDEEDIFFYNPVMKKRIEQKININEKLRTSLQNNQFDILFEPVFDLNSMTIVQLSAQLNWRDAHLKALSLAELDEVAEEISHTLIIFETTFTNTLQNYLDQSFTTPLSFKVTYKQMEHTAFLTTLKRIIDHMNFPLRFLSFELTGKNGKIQNHKIMNVLKELKRLSIDLIFNDVSDNSSFINELLTRQVKQVKMDWNLLNHESDPTLSRMIFQSIKELTSYLKIDLIMEGIHSEAILQQVKAEKLCYGSGSYLGKPLSINNQEEDQL